MARRGRSGGIGGLIWSIFALVVVAAILFSAAKINNINSVGDAIDFFKSKSDETSECASGEGWKCNPFGSDGNSDKGSDSDTGDKKPDKDSAKPATSYLKTLESIPTVEAKEVDYSRGEWKHWTGSPCNTREEIIKSSGEGVKTDSDCSATTGTWTDPYTGTKYTDASKMDLDHVIPLGYGSSHGGNGWSEELKTKYANDKSQLLLVGATPNRSKGDKGPSEWMPDDSFKCEYSKIWVDTAKKYSSDGLGLAKADKETLKKTLETCG